MINDMSVTGQSEAIPDEMLGLELQPSELRLWRTFLRAHATVVRRLAKDLEDAGVSFSDHQALVFAGAAGAEGVRMSDLSEHILLSRSAVTRLVDRLEREGLVARRECLEDRRGTYVALTTEGLAVVRRVAPIHMRGVREAFVERVDPELRAAMLKGLSAVVAPEGGTE